MISVLLLTGFTSKVYAASGFADITLSGTLSGPQTAVSFTHLMMLDCSSSFGSLKLCSTGFPGATIEIPGIGSGLVFLEVSQTSGGSTGRLGGTDTVASLVIRNLPGQIEPFSKEFDSGFHHNHIRPAEFNGIIDIRGVGVGMAHFIAQIQ
jgi:hypothetical protein